MSVRFDEKWLKEYCARMGNGNPSDTAAPCHLPLHKGGLEDDTPEEQKRTKPSEGGAEAPTSDSRNRRCSGRVSATRECAGRTKYGNRKVTEGGRTFDSQHERDVYSDLMLEARAGKYCAVICQVPFELPGGIKYVADFVTLEKDGRFAVWDAKSPATAKDKVYRIKKRLMRECLGIEIKEV